MAELSASLKIRLPQDERDLLERVAAFERRSLASTVRMAIADYCATRHPSMLEPLPAGELDPRH